MNSLFNRFLVIIPIIILSGNLRSQTVDSITQLIDKIQVEKTELLLRVDSLNLLSDYLQVQRNEALQKQSFEGFYGTTTFDKDVFDTSYQVRANKLFKIPVGTRLCILEQENMMYRIYSNGENRYVYTGFLNFDDEGAKEILQTNWNNRKSDMDEIKRKKRQAEIDEARKLEEINQKRKSADALARRKQAAEERKKTIYSRYPENVATKILDGKIWIGMTKQMAIDSWGHPRSNNRTVTENIVKEQCVYRRNYNTVYLYFRNGILYTYQD